MTFYDDPAVLYRDTHTPYRGQVSFPAIDFDRDYATNAWIVDRSGNRLQELSTAVIDQCTWKLNDVGDAKLTMPIDDPRNQRIVLGQTEVLIQVGAEWWWGIPMRCQNTPTTSAYQLDELMMYYNYRFVLNASLDYTDMDQVAIAAAISEFCQTGTLLSFNIATGAFPASGRIRSRKYERNEHPNVLDMLQEFTKLDDGFDISVQYDGSGLRQFWCHYPQKGVVRPQLVMEWGRNIVDFEVDEDAARLATRVYATGGSNGDVKFEENYADDAAAALLGTHYEDVVSDGSQKDVGWLLGRATQEVNERRVPTVIPSITVVDDPVQVFGVVKTGDTVPVRISLGRVQVNSNHRIIEIARNVTERNTQLTLVPA